MLWPPPRTATVRSFARAKPSAAITSAGPVQRAITAGSAPSWAPFQMRFASS